MKYIILIIVFLYLIQQYPEQFTEKKGFSENYNNVFNTHKLNFF